MTELFYDFFISVNQNLGASGIFVICISLLTVTFLLAVVFAYFKSYDIKKRVWFVFALLGISGIELAFSILCYHTDGYSLLTFSVGLIYAIPVFTVRKKSVVTQKQRELVKFIDEQINKDDIKEQKFKKTEELFSENYTQPPFEELNAYDADKLKPTAVKFNSSKVKSDGCDLDFTHVKNVIARLEYFSLGVSDRRQVKELETTVLAAEAGDFTPETKNKINDGLGALLKIMSKYGV